MRFKGGALIAAVFALGGLAGAGITYASLRADIARLATDDSYEAREQRRLSALRRQLGLDDAQSERVRALFQRFRPERRRLLRAAFEQCGKPLREQKMKLDGELRSLLRPEQQHRFDELIQSQGERFPFGPRSDG